MALVNQNLDMGVPTCQRIRLSCSELVDARPSRANLGPFGQLRHAKRSPIPRFCPFPVFPRSLSAGVADLAATQRQPRRPRMGPARCRRLQTMHNSCLCRLPTPLFSVVGVSTTWLPFAPDIWLRSPNKQHSIMSQGARTE